MRIGILTFHAALNPGAFLQAMGTTQTLRRLGHDPVIIDYMPRRLRPNPYTKFLSLKTLTARGFRKNMDRLRLYKAFQQAWERLPITPRFSSHRQVQREHFDAVVVGADIVWNFRSKHFGRDAIYFGDSLNCGRLVAYSPSCGVCTPQDDIPAYVSEGLARFHAISVRDEVTKAVVHKACGREARVNLDPAFDLDITGLGEKPDLEDYMLVYAYNPFEPSEVKEIQAYARQHGLRTVAVCYRLDWCDENRLALNPFQWLGFIQHAQVVATGMFHGTVFSLKYGKNVAVSLNRAIRSKTEPVLTRLGLMGRAMSAGRTLEEIYAEPIDYGRVHHELSTMAGATVDWLRDALNG